MIRSAQLQFFVSLIALFSARHAAGACGGNKPLTMCCLGVAPFSTNAAVWGGICGYTPSSPNEIIGGRCITISGSSSCPIGSIPTCCSGVWPGPSGQCALGTNCGTPSSTSTSSSASSTPSTLPPVVPAPIPADWTTDFACSSDSAPRVLSNALVSQVSINTPSNCISHCSSKGYIYAGVEYGSECVCGTGYKSSPAPSSIDSSNCDMRCSGNNSFTCGGSWAIQLYRGPAPQDNFPSGWAPVDACAVDTPSRVLADVVTTQTTNNTPGKCAFHCSKQGYAYAGVEYGNECHCGTGIKPHETAPKSECDMPCSGSNGLTCGAGWRIQIYAQSSGSA